jgi:hypothetical protein
MLIRKLNKFILLFTMTLTSAAFGHGDGEESRIAIEPNINKSAQAGLISYQFELVDTKTRTVIGPNDLNIVHEKPTHIFIFDTSLQEYHHLHPEFKNGVWESTLKLERNGKYQVFVQGELKADGEEFTSPTNFSIVGGQNAHPLPPLLGHTSSGTDGASIVTLTGRAKAGKMAMLTLHFSRTDGQKPIIENFLGAKAHVVATPSDADTLLHVHPMEGDSDNQLMIHVTFPAKGEYRLWIQFQDRGELKTVPLSAKID